MQGQTLLSPRLVDENCQAFGPDSSPAPAALAPSFVLATSPELLIIPVPAVLQDLDLQEVCG